MLAAYEFLRILSFLMPNLKQTICLCICSFYEEKSVMDLSKKLRLLRKNVQNRV